MYEYEADEWRLRRKSKARDYLDMLFPHHGDIPEWDDGARCFELFMRHHSETPPTEAERNEFALLVMRWLSIKFRTNNSIIFKRVYRAGLYPPDVAGHLAMFIVTRVVRFKLKTPCAKVMVAAFATTVSRQLCDLIRYHDRPLCVDRCGPLVAPAAPADDSTLAMALRRRPTIEKLTVGIIGDRAVILRLARHQRQAILRRGRQDAYRELPTRLSQCTEEEHAIITSRIVRFVSAWAEDEGIVFPAAA